MGQRVRLGESLPPAHSAQFIADVLTPRDFAPREARDGACGGAAAPEVRFGLLVCGCATGVFSTRKTERATAEAAPCRERAGTGHPAHATLAPFRQACRRALAALVVQLLLPAPAGGVVRRGASSLAGTTVQAEAAKRTAVSDRRLGAAAGSSPGAGWRQRRGRGAWSAGPGTCRGCRG